jgi:hypothetical protein
MLEPRCTRGYVWQTRWIGGERRTLARGGRDNSTSERSLPPRRNSTASTHAANGRHVTFLSLKSLALGTGSDGDYHRTHSLQNDFYHCQDTARPLQRDVTRVLEFPSVLWTDIFAECSWYTRSILGTNFTRGAAGGREITNRL